MSSQAQPAGTPLHGRVLYATGSFTEPAPAPAPPTRSFSKMVPQPLQAALLVLADPIANPARRAAAARAAAEQLRHQEVAARGLDSVYFRPQQAAQRREVSAREDLARATGTIKSILTAAYRDPRQAQLVMNSITVVHGAAATARTVAERPETLGALRGSVLLDRAGRTAAIRSIAGTEKTPGLAYWVEEQHRRKGEYSTAREQAADLHTQANSNPAVAQGLAARQIIQDVTTGFGAAETVSVDLLLGAAHDLSLQVTPGDLAADLDIPADYRAQLQDQVARRGRLSSYESLPPGAAFGRYQEAREIVLENYAASMRLEAAGERHAAGLAGTWLAFGERALVTDAAAVMSEPEQQLLAADANLLDEISALVAAQQAQMRGDAPDQGAEDDFAQ